MALHHDWHERKILSMCWTCMNTRTCRCITTGTSTTRHDAQSEEPPPAPHCLKVTWHCITTGTSDRSVNVLDLTFTDKNADIQAPVVASPQGRLPLDHDAESEEPQTSSALSGRLYWRCITPGTSTALLGPRHRVSTCLVAW